MANALSNLVVRQQTVGDALRLYDIYRCFTLAEQGLTLWFNLSSSSVSISCVDIMPRVVLDSAHRPLSIKLRRYLHTRCVRIFISLRLLIHRIAFLAKAASQSQSAPLKYLILRGDVDRGRVAIRLARDSDAGKAGLGPLVELAVLVIWCSTSRSHLMMRQDLLHRVRVDFLVASRVDSLARYLVDWQLRCSLEFIKKLWLFCW